MLKVHVCIGDYVSEVFEVKAVSIYDLQERMKELEVEYSNADVIFDGEEIIVQRQGKKMFEKIMDKAIRRFGFEDKRTIIICTVCEKIADALKQ